MNKHRVLTIPEVTRTCWGCPAQWETTLDNGDYIYIRYRYGMLRMDINHDPIIYLDHGGSLDGTMSFDELQQILARYDIAVLKEVINEYT